MTATETGIETGGTEAGIVTVTGTAGTNRLNA
jgi:hypothetical protein